MEDLLWIIENARTKKEITRIITPRAPQVGEYFAQLSPKAERVHELFVVEGVVTFLYVSGDKLVAENRTTRPHGKILVREVKEGKAEVSA